VSGFGARLEARLCESDSVQVGTLLMVALVVAFATVWPSPGQISNESWYAFAQVRSVLVALLALGYGASAASESLERRLATASMVVVFALLTLPLEVATYAATYPATPLWWSLVTIPLAAAGYTVLGVVVGRVTRALRLGVLLPVVVPLLLVVLLLLDVRFGWTIANPLTAAVAVSPWFLMTMTTLVATGMLTWGWALLRTRRRSVR